MHGRAVLKIGDSMSISNDSSNPTPTQGDHGNLVSSTLQEAVDRAGRDFRSDTVTVPDEHVMQVSENSPFIHSNWY
jgi:hypothetical protein